MMYLERLIALLETAANSGPVTVADLSTQTGLPKPTVYRLVRELVDTGLLEPGAKGRFAVGARLRRIADPGTTDARIMDSVVPALRAAAGAHGVAFFLSRLRGKSVEIIHVETPDTGVSYLHPGLGRRPLHACSCSKAVAAFSPDLLHEAEMAGQLRAYTEFTLTRLEDLEAEIEIIRDRGFAECVEEIERGMCSVAAPLARDGDLAQLSIGAAGSVRVFTPAFRQSMGAQLVGMSDDLSARLTGSVVARRTA